MLHSFRLAVCVCACVYTVGFDVLNLCPQAIETCVAAAGFSVGEFAALVFSGAMNFAEGKQGKTKLSYTAAAISNQYSVFTPAVFSSFVCSEGACRGHAESIRADSQWNAVSDR